MEAVELFNALESNHPQTVEDTKKKFHDYFNSTRESWLLNCLFDYHITTGSVRIVEILVGVREPHDRYLFDKISESIRGQQKIEALTLLGHVVRKHPTWLYKIVHHQLIKDLLKLLKSETEIIPFMTALLIVVALLPIIAGLFGPFLQEMFEVFSRLAAWNTNYLNKGPDGSVLHLQIGLYALFNRLYGMYPCNFLSYLRGQYNVKENIPIFSHTIKPMLDTVKMHPLLVTASKDTEVAAARWKKLEANDVIIECAKFSVESIERCRDECSFRGRSPSFRSRSSLDCTASLLDGNKLVIGAGLRDGGVANYSANLPDGDDVWSPSIYCGAPTPPESAPTSIPHTPIGQTYSASSTFPQQEGTSPPEAAVEATPESTPVKDIRQSLRVPPPASSVARALNTFAAIQHSTQSQPSSPMKKEPSPFRFPPASTPPVISHESASSAFQAATARPKETSIVMQRVQRVVLDRIQADKDSPTIELKALGPKTPTSYQPSSPLRVIKHQSVWPESSVPGSPQFLPSEHTEEDKEVETTMRLDHPSTPVQNSQVKRGDSVLHDHSEVNRVEGEDYEGCSGSGVKGCMEGGLHMPDTRSMLQFTRQVNRLRLNSASASDSFHLSQIGVSSSSSPREGSGFPDVKVRRAISCPEMKKASTADIGVNALDKTVEEETENSEEQSAIINGLSGGMIERKRLVSCCTQTDDPQPLVYEHLFLTVFPPVEQQQHSAPPDITSPPLFSSNYLRFSPYTALENYIETAVRSHSEKSQKHTSYENELKACEDQLKLLLLQLQYERYRREIHAERNRRLLGKSRYNRALEEYNSALRDQVSLLQKDIETLRSELERTKREAKFHSDQIQQNVMDLQNQNSSLQKKLVDANERVSVLEQELIEEKQKTATLSKNYNNAQAAVFELENTLRSAVAEASVGRGFRNEMSVLQHRLTVAGEVETRLRSRLDNLTLRANTDIQKLQATQVYSHHTAALQQRVNSRSASLDAAKARLTELELALERKDALLSEQKQLLHSAQKDYDRQLKVVEKEKNSLREANNKQEERVLELMHKLEMFELDGKKTCPIAGGTSQAGSPPLSTSLSSSGTLSLSGAEPSHIKNLQLLVDTPELPGSSKDQLSPL